MNWNQEHFTGTSIFAVSNPPLKSIAGIDWDNKTRTKSIFKFVGSGHKGWSRHVDTELGNYDYLLGADVSVFTSSAIS